MRKTLLWMMLALATAFVLGTIGAWWLQSEQAMVSMSSLLATIEQHRIALRVWRILIYSALMVSWPAIGRWLRGRDSRAWTDQDVMDFNRYRWRLLVILVVFDLIAIEGVITT